ncbi:hypothetical protein B0T25DRAFT_547383 [Lasiosphaeria hispida]|uniref:Rhodopsin domain-containing protein n=1 Tax=Lasiosphaeria hispida TaxID=260671 RepID=A0AAJ0HE50_9PEZI|nr:hypothetical protein B0T25DRAFT_547383 [Lasiosphaeria hispida]
MSSETTPSRIRLWGDGFVITPSNGPYPYSGLQILGFVILASLPTLSLTVCGFRIYSRRLANGFGMDDWFIFSAMFLAVPQAVFTAFVLKSGYWGVHDRDIPLGNPSNLGAFWVFVNGLVYNPTLALVKVSALLFLLRLGGTKKRVRIACRAMIVFNLALMVTFFLIFLFQCLPIKSLWVTVPSAHCVRRDVISVSLAVANIVTDILTLSIPFLLFLSLKISKRARNALLVVFLLGAIVTVISFIRMYYITRLYYFAPDDRHYSIGYVCSCVELNLAIITASAPALWPLARRWAPGAFVLLGIDRPHLYPEIEVAYATHQSQAGWTSKRLRGKTTWQERRRGAPDGGHLHGGSSDGDLLAAPPGIPKRPMHAHGSGGKRSGQWRGEEDDEILGWHTIILSERQTHYEGREDSYR